MLYGTLWWHSVGGFSTHYGDFLTQCHHFCTPLLTGGYYLTTLYASLYYISSFRPRLAARQLSVEAQQSLNQWHRRRTLHCNQSRRSKHRRTIRRQACREGNKDESRSENASVNADRSQAQTESNREALQTLSEERGREQGAEDQSKPTTPTSDSQPVTQEVVTTSTQDNNRTFDEGEEEDHKEL